MPWRILPGALSTADRLHHRRLRARLDWVDLASNIKSAQFRHMGQRRPNEPRGRRAS